MHSADKQEGSWSGTPPENAGHGSSTDSRADRGPEQQAGWSADGAAADFLGLDQEVAPAVPEGRTEDSNSAVLGSNSWLLSLEGEAPPQDRPIAQAEFAEAQAEFAETAEPEALAEPSEPDEAAPTPPAKRRSRAPLYALAATVVLATGGWFAWNAWQASSTGSGTETPVAVAPKPARPTQKPSVDPATAPTPTADPVVSATQPTPTEPATTTTAEPTPAPAGATFQFGERASDGRVREFVDAHAGGTDVDGLSTTRSSATLPLLAAENGEVTVPTSGSPDGGASSRTTPVPTPETIEPAPEAERRVKGSGRTALRLATDADLEGVWSETSIPHAAIEANARLVTPMVGRVRLAFHDGELFEGRMYAVGQGRIWLDTELGRTTLESYRVARIEQLSSGPGTPSLGSKGSAELAGLPRMRVRTPGGMLYGRVIDRNERNVTIVTEAGARITIETNEVEPAPEGRSLIVRGHVKPTAP